MKRIGTSFSEQQWNNRIVGQLSFIKKHLRYPIGRKTALPVVLLTASSLWFGFIFFNIVLAKRHFHGPDWLILLLPAFFVLPSVVAVMRYLQTLRFVTVNARPLMAENMLLLQQFLQQNHFAYARHPEAPEVFQIISQSIGALRNEREVVVFIADDRRILINSHFTRNRFNAPVGSPHYKEMAKSLDRWLQLHNRNNSGYALQPF